MGAHHRPDSDFDEESESYPDLRTPQTAYRQGFATGVIVAWTIVLVGWVAYLIMNPH